VTFFWEAMTRGPARHRWVDADGVRTRVLELGPTDGEALVFLHGIGGHLEAFAFNVGALAAEHRVMAFDLPGHGYSSGPQDRSYEIAGYASHLLALLEALDVPRATLCGLSLGGWISARFAVDQPHRVERLLLIAPGGATFDERVMSSITSLSTQAVTDPSEENVRRRLEWLMADPGSVTAELVACRKAIYESEGYHDRMARTLCLQDPDVRRRNLIPAEDWASIRHPALVCWGTRDATAPSAKGAEVASMLPNGRFERLEGLGHWPQFEDPARFNDLACQFLSSRGSKAVAGAGPGPSSPGRSA
jgi:2-hydroxy-6-oxonona-2,4-dienedioate hydrolase